jgi:hypothetical protein
LYKYININININIYIYIHICKLGGAAAVALNYIMQYPWEFQPQVSMGGHHKYPINPL